MRVLKKIKELRSYFGEKGKKRQSDFERGGSAGQAKRGVGRLRAGIAER